MSVSSPITLAYDHHVFHVMITICFAVGIVAVLLLTLQPDHPTKPRSPHEPPGNEFDL